MSNRLIVLALAVLAVVVAVVISRPGAAHPDRPPTEWLYGTITSTDGHGISGAIVEVLALDEHAPAPRRIAVVLSDGTGRYLVERPARAEPVGTPLLVRVLAIGHAATGRQWLDDDDHPRRQDFVLATTSTMVIVRVVDPANAPVPGAAVTIAFEPRVGDQGTLVVFDAVTDERGLAHTPPISPVGGTVHWSASRPGRGRGFGQLVKAAGSAPLEIIARLEPGTPLVVHVVDRAHRPVPGVEVRFDEEDGPWTASKTADATGVFTLAEVPAAVLGYRTEGHYTLAGGYDHLAFDPSTGRQLEVVVETAGSITGRVVDPGGDPIAGATVTAQTVDRTMGSPKSAVTDDDGRFELTGLRTGGWDIEARHRDRAPGFAEQVAIGASIELVLSGGGGAHGRVDDGHGRPLAGITVYVHRIERADGLDLGLAEHAQVATGPRGDWALAHLNPGLYRLEYRSRVRMAWESIATRVDTIQIEADRDLEVAAVSLRRGARLAGTVDPSVRALALSLLPQGQGGAPHQLQVAVRDGRFVVTDLAPGSYDVVVREPVAGYSKPAAVTLVADRETRFEPVFAGRGELVGRVVDAAGVAVPHAKIDVFTAAGQQRYPLPDRAPDNFTGNLGFTGDDGTFRIGGLATGSYRIRVEAGALGTALQTLSIDQARRELVIALPPPAQIVAHVERDHRPAAGVVVLLESAVEQSISTSSTTDAAGNATFDGLPAGSYRVRSVAAGLPEQRIDVVAGARMTVALPAP